MKKHLAILFLAAGMLLGGAQQGQAVDFKAKGVWINMLEYGGGGNFVKNDRNGHNVTGWGRWGEDEFEAKTRVRLQLEAIASESLSGTVYFEIGAATWGSASKGGALGADKNIVKIKHSYLDWVVPGTAVKAAWASSVSSCRITPPRLRRSSMPTWRGSTCPPLLASMPP